MIYNVTIFSYDFLLCFAEEKALVEKKNNNPDSDSSSLPSLDNDQESETENKQDNKKKKTVEKGKSSKSQKVSQWVRIRGIKLCD